MMTGHAAWSAPRFLATELGQPGDEIVLPREEAHHLVHVLRLRPGDEIVVFDGHGREFAATVSHSGRGTARAVLAAPREPVAEPAVPFAVVQALLKGGGMDAVVRDATMIGAARIEPVVSAHVAVRSAARGQPAVAERWQRIAIASAKQCRRALLPAIPPVRPLNEWLRGPRADLVLIFVEPGATEDALPMRALSRREAPRYASLLIGPEGGWAADEIQLVLAAGALPVTLGGLTLRADAVALVAGALVRFLWDQR